MKAYLAGSIFYYGDYLRNKEWAAKIRRTFPSIDLYSPIENTDINGVEGKKKFAGSLDIAEADNKRLDNTDILIACIDGDVLPSGTCAEIGKFHEKIRKGEKKYLIGICTDNRQCALTHSEAKDAGGAKTLGEQQYSYQNLYVTGLIKQVGFLVSSIDEVIEVMKLIDSDLKGRKETEKIPVTRHDKEPEKKTAEASKVVKNAESNVEKPESKKEVNVDIDFDNALKKLCGSINDSCSQDLCKHYDFYNSESYKRMKSALDYFIDILMKED